MSERNDRNDRHARNGRDDARMERARREADRVRAAADRAREEELRKKREYKEAWEKSLDGMANASGDGSSLANHISGGRTTDIQDFGIDRVVNGAIDKVLPSLMPSDIFAAGISGINEVGEKAVHGTVNGIRKVFGFKDEEAATPDAPPATPQQPRNGQQPRGGQQPAGNGSQPAARNGSQPPAGRRGRRQ